MENVLLIDTSADTCTVLVHKAGELIAEITSPEARNHAANINLMIEEALKKAEITFKELNGVGVCAGPGSYTGLRIGMATAKGLCFALDIPLFADNKLALLSYALFCNLQFKGKKVGAVLKAREKEYFIQLFDAEFNPIDEAKHISEDELAVVLEKNEDLVLSTTVFPTFLKELHGNKIYVHEIDQIDPKNWCLFSHLQYMSKNSVKLSTAEPFYLKQVYTHK